MTPRPQFDAAYLEAELQELGNTLGIEVTAFLIGGGEWHFEDCGSAVGSSIVTIGEWFDLSLGGGSVSAGQIELFQ